MKEHILIVEDDAIALEGMKLSLELEGFQVKAVDSGKRALKILTTQNFDLILSDIVMEETSGIDLLLEVKHRWPETIVILITGFGSLDTVIQALRLGAYDYLLKPCSDEELKIRIKRGLERKRMGQIVKEKNRQDAVFHVVEGLAEKLNNLLAGISGNHEILRTYFSDDKDPDVLNSFHNASVCINKSARIVDSLCTTVTLFKKTDVRAYDLHEAFLGVKMQFDVDRLLFEIPEKLPYVIGNDRLTAAFSNIIQNSLEATQNGDKVNISSRIDPTGEFVEILFEDQGCGIAPEMLSKVFLPFYSGKSEEQAGLGLWVAYQTVTYFNGTIDISSTRDSGTVVSVRLPIYR
jgi:DNA-binding response OmpR family regulator